MERADYNPCCNTMFKENELIRNRQTSERIDFPSAQENNKLYPQDKSVHDWYRFVLSFPAHLVRRYIAKLNISPGNIVLDPFCGTGTTLVECKKNGIESLGLERNPVAHFASAVKINWEMDPEGLIAHAEEISKIASQRLETEGFSQIPLPLFSVSIPKSGLKLRTLPSDKTGLLLKNSISSLPLHRTLVLLDVIEEHRQESFYQHERLALAKAIVFGISNLCFGPEVGVGRSLHDAPVVALWLENVRTMAADLRNLGSNFIAESKVYLGDARYVDKHLGPGMVDAVITSPPYPNEKDYTRTTRLESVILGFLQDKEQLRRIKQELVRSNTRSVYKTDSDDLFIEGYEEISRVAEAIENRRIELGKTSGFERLYARVTKLYFGGMAAHLARLRKVLRPGAGLAYVVGDQASYLRIMIRTGQLLAIIAENLGYEVVGIDLFRTRLSTATKEQLREEVVLLKWKGTQRIR